MSQLSFKTYLGFYKDYGFYMADKLQVKGNEAFKAKNFQEAGELYASAIQLDPQNAVLYSNRAMTLIKLEDWATCVSVCNTGLSKNPDSKTKLKLLWRRGMAEVKLEDFKAAKISYTTALDLEPTNSMVIKSMEELRTMESQFKRSHSVDEKTSEKRAKTIENIPIYEVDELPVEFRDLSSSSSQEASTSKPSTLSTPSAHSEKISLPRKSPLIEEINESQPTTSITQATHFPTTPTLQQLTTIMKTVSPQTLRYVFDLPTTTLQKIYSTGCLDSAVLNFVLRACLHVLESSPSEESTSKTLELLHMFTEVPRFSLVCLFCDKSILSKIEYIIRSQDPNLCAIFTKWK